MWIPPVIGTKKGTKGSRERDTAVVSGWSIFQSLPFRWQLEGAARLVPLFGAGAALGLCPLPAKKHQSAQWTWKLSVEPPRSWGGQRRLGQLLRGVWMLAGQWGAAVLSLWALWASCFPEWGMWRGSATTGWACSISSAAAIKEEACRSDSFEF